MGTTWFGLEWFLTLRLFPHLPFSRETYRERCCVSDAVAVGGATLLLPGCPALVSGAFPVCLSPDASLPSSLSILPACFLVHILISVSPTFSSWSTRQTISPLPDPPLWSPFSSLSASGLLPPQFQ